MHMHSLEGDGERDRERERRYMGSFRLPGQIAISSL